MAGNKRRQYWLRLGRFFLALSILTWVFLVFGSANFYLNELTNPDCPTAPPPPPGFISIDLPQPDGTILNGWWHSQNNGSVIMLIGGHGSNRTALEQEARLLSNAGYGVITSDTRHCNGQPLSFGWLEMQEAESMLTYAQTNAPNAQIGALGFSAGAVSILRTAANHPQIRAIVAEGNYANLYHEMTNSAASPLSYRWQLEHAVAFLYTLRTGVSPQQIDMPSQLEKISPRPVLLIHGDREASDNEAHQQLSSAGENARLWIIPNCGHGGYPQAAPLEYNRELISFYKENLNNQ